MLTIRRNELHPLQGIDTVKLYCHPVIPRLRRNELHPLQGIDTITSRFLCKMIQEVEMNFTRYRVLTHLVED